MATARRGRANRGTIQDNLPTPAEAAAAIQEAARRLGLLIDLHRVATRLRQMDQHRPARVSS